ncbi:unnamed protein product [Miscanthus lutarioriparius]|uniref:F-box domain-containing protein n=1 Tax=Miscanthus lutarioriparius TaxID=422564 RepID=A0A811NGR5_9POAL|nr:unnamed protein product [Miscanthus lutarioriparius]
MEGCSKTSADAVPVLSDDPLVEILSRVPAKSVCRFKCVSKAWRDLIVDPDNLISVPLDIYPSFSFLAEMTGVEAFILDSYNGLILFGHRQEPFDPLYYTVCNPTTKQWSAVAAYGSGEPDYDTQEWVLKNTVDFNSLDVFGEIRDLSEFKAVDIHQDCNVVFFLQESCKLTAYGMDHKEVSVIATFEDHKDPCDFACYVPYFSESPDLTNKY